MQRYLRAAVWVVLVLGLVGSVAALLYSPFFLQNRIDHAVHEHVPPSAKPDMTVLGNAGEYISARFGITATLVTAVATLLVGLIGSGLLFHFTSTKDEVEILNFFARISTSLGRNIARITQDFEALVQKARMCREEVDAILEKQFDAALQAGKPLPPPSEIEASLPKDVKERFEALSQSILDDIREWNESYSRILNAPYETAIANERIRAVRRRTPIEFLRRSVPEPLHEAIGLAHEEYAIPKLGEEEPPGWREHPEDPRELLSLLISTQKQTEFRHMFWANIECYLARSTNLEYLGAIIYAPTLYLAKPIKRRDVEISRFQFAVGTAALLTLFEYLPDRRAVASAFHKIFESRSAVGEAFLRHAGPEPLQFVRQSFHDYVKDHCENRKSALILAHTSDGPQPYEANKHGPIPSDRKSYLP